MKRWALTIILATLALNSAQAASCNKSRDYLLGSLGGDLPEPPQAYQALFKVCMATAAMANVKDVFILKDGGIAVIPKQDSVPATAATLSTFCTAYPRGILRFITRKELPQAKSIGKVVQMSSTGATPCRKIMGNSPS
jgi:hypothetical protein